MRKLMPIPLFSLCLVLLTPLALRADNSEADAPAVYRRVLRSTAYVETPKLGISGTGWVVDKARRLLVTNEHVVGDQDNVVVMFPAYRDGQVIAERSYYGQNARLIRGRVVDTDVGTDLAVIQLESLPADIEQLQPATASPVPGEAVYSIGNPSASGAFWVFTSGRVRAVYNRRWPTDTGKALTWRSARVVETASPINPGDSGGPVVNGRGELVAVTEGHSARASLMSWSIDIGEVKGFMAAVGRILAPATGEDYSMRGARCRMRGRFDDAITAYTEAIRLRPKVGWLHRDRGECFAGKGDYQTAVADYDEALALAKSAADHALAYEGRGKVSYLKKDYEQAVTDLTRALQHDARSVEAHRYRGDTHLAKKRYDLAHADYSRMIALAPQDELGYNGRGLCLHRQGRHDDALADFNAALKFNPYRADVWTNRGHSFYAKKDYQNALDDAVAALKLDPKHALAFELAGNVFFCKQEYTKAVTAYSETIRLSPADAYPYFWRGWCHRSLGDQSKAQSDFEQAVRLDRGYADQVPDANAAR